MFIRSFLFICLCSIFIAVASGTCYWIDGTEAADRFPCFDLNSVGASMCCDKASSAFFDSCADGGICAYTYASGVQGRYDDGLSFWRDACSDPTWRDPACLHVASYVTSSQVRLSKCGDGSFCPRNTDDLNTTCCDNHQGEYVSTNSVIAANPELATSRSWSYSSSTSTTSNPEAATSTSLSYSSSASITETTSVATSTSLSKSPKDAGDGLARVSEIATILGSVFGALTVVLALVFGINSWRKRHNQATKSVSNVYFSP